MSPNSRYWQDIIDFRRPFLWNLSMFNKYIYKYTHTLWLAFSAARIACLGQISVSRSKQERAFGQMYIRGESESKLSVL